MRLTIIRTSLDAALALAGLALVSPLSAQQASVTGRVTDQASTQPLAGVRVSVVGTNRAAFTNQDGRYTINSVPAGPQRMQAAIIGYAAGTQPVEVPATGSATADFALKISAVSLDALVVTATGEQRAREIPNAITTVNASAINEKAPVTNMADLLNSRAPGLVVESSGGTTGAGVRVRIRGSNSVSLSNEPVIYMDGVRVENSAQSSSIGVGGQNPSRLNDINPNDIETFDVIKGPSATALYGTTAANGIIQIKSKFGQEGPARWHLYTEAGTQADYAAYPANYSSDCLLMDQADGLCTQTSLLSFNPLEVNSPFRTGSRAQYGLNVSGGGKEATYYLSGEQEGERGIYQANRLKRTSLRANIRANVSPKLDVAVATGFVSSDLRRPENDNNSFGILASGLLGLADTTNGGYGFLTPQQSMSLVTNQKINRFTGSIVTNWYPISWLRARAVLGVDFTNRYDERTTFPGKIPAAFSVTANEGSRAANRDNILNVTATLNASATFDVTPTVRSTTTGGLQFLRDQFQGNRASGRKLVAGSNSLTGVVIPAVGEVNDQAKTFGAFIEEQVGWRERVFFTAAVRGDDNSAFGKDFDFIAYPKVGASWVISDEGFFPRSSVVSSLRLRAAYGLSGLQPGTTDAQQYFDPVAVTALGVDVPGFTIGNLGNQNLKPEKSREVELGFEAGLFRERGSLEFTFYSKKSTDALIAVTLAPSLGGPTTQFFNLGEVSNKGVEISLGMRVFNRSNLSLDVDASAWGNRNRLIELGQGIEPIIFGLGGASQRHQEGYPLGSFFVLPYTYADANGDGLIGSNEVTVGSEPTFHGTPFPTSGGSLSGTLRIGNYVQVYGLLDGRWGNKLFNSTEEFRCGFVICRGLNDSTASLADQARAIAAALAPTTTEAGFIEDAGFVKLRELSVTFSAPERWAQRMRLSGLRLTLSGRNLATWTKYTGFDPEILGGGQANFSTFEFLSQPPVRYFTARFSLNL
jgi:TonB-dependent starch-binding outer membrane protein SusC